MQFSRNLLKDYQLLAFMKRTATLSMLINIIDSIISRKIMELRLTLIPQLVET
jgi:cell fate (sporulation/competence/biofilm development) regulator YlbF (YheA/YmcA/DUF963 family)